ncbi:Hydrolase tropI [Colletotrichum viniferum]|nr:Hydrolase tropI [Colletotrichum viniferum]
MSTILAACYLFGLASGFVADLSLLAFAGTPVGQVINFNGLDIYVSKPKEQSGSNGMPAQSKPTVGIVHLTDVFGIQSTENKLLTDSFARAGYVTIMPDLFNGKPRSEDPKSGFNATEFFGSHGPSVTDPIVTTALSYMRDQMGDDEIKAISGPASLAIAEKDTGMKIQRRIEIEMAMARTGQPWTMNLYGGVPHGFATHPNLDVPVEKAGKEDAFLQAVRFFESWV